MAEASPVNSNEPLALLLLGVTGHGKSATGNTILGWRQFTSRGGGNSVTKEHHVGYAKTSDGYLLKVVDIPGYGEGDWDRNQSMQMISTALTKALVKLPYGFDVLLFTIAYHQHVNDYERESLKVLMEKFGAENFKKTGILVVTQGDIFIDDHPDDDIKTYLKENDFQ